MARTDGEGQGPSVIDVAVCTFRRDSLEATLESIAAQTLPAGLSLRVIVADNDETPVAEARIHAIGARLGLDLDYRHAPVRAVYDSAAPGWMRRGDFHSTRPVVRRGAIDTGYSGNVLLRRAFVETAGLRFDLRFGRTGGEDLDFFYRLRDAGGRIGFAPDAWVDEPVPSGRASLAWLLSRTFRAGQSHGSRLTALQPKAVGRVRQAALAGAKAAVCGCGALATLPRPATRNRFLTRGALHLGVLARVAGFREIELY
jgi:succinoglycan biosynthesis protein ExoM